LDEDRIRYNAGQAMLDVGRRRILAWKALFELDLISFGVYPISWLIAWNWG
jgi:hypothetical protein